jgi:hypothetical protein
MRSHLATTRRDSRRRAVGLLAAVVALACVSAPGPLGAQRAPTAVRAGWSLSPNGAVKIHNLVGRVRVIGWDRDSVSVEGTVPAGLRFYGGGGRSGVKLGVEGDQQGPASAAVLIVRVPATSKVAVRGAQTEIEAEGLTGPVDLATVSGRLHVTGSPSDLLVETMDGDLTVIGSPETMRARTASGAFVWEGTAREATITTVDGPVRITRGPLERARIETVSGRVLLDVSLHARGDVLVETHGGDVELVLGAAEPVRLSADAARISGSGITASERALGRPAEPRVIDLYARSGVAPSAHLTVRSFKGQVIVRAP